MVANSMKYNGITNLKISGCILLHFYRSNAFSHQIHREKICRGANLEFFLLGRTVRADIFGRIFLGSQKFSQMAAYVCKSENVESSVTINNILSNKHSISMFDLSKGF